MAKKPDTADETLENPINNESKKPSGENISSLETNIINIQQETSNMETHANHLHKAPGNRIWHYFFEFIMLFLAVFCGFLTENLRENRIDKGREKVYINNLYQDLKSDTAIYSNYDKSSLEFLNKIDSLMMLMKRPDRNVYMSKIYFLARTATFRTFTFFSTNEHLIK